MGINIVGVALTKDSKRGFGTSALLGSAKAVGALGLLSLSLSGEVELAFLATGWTFWLGSFWADRFPAKQLGLRKYEAIVIVGMVAFFPIDFFLRQSSVFLSIAHFLLLFQLLKLAGPKTRADGLQVFLFGFFQLLAACTLSVNVWHAILLFLLIPAATSTLFWNFLEKDSEVFGEEIPPQVRKPFVRMATGMCLIAVPLNVLLTLAVFILFPRLTLNVSMPGFNSGRMGFIDQVNLVGSGNLHSDSSPVLWLAFASPKEAGVWNGYLRGATLDSFDGRQWRPSRKGSTRTFLPGANNIFSLGTPSRADQSLRQTITLLNTSASTLFAAGSPFQVIAPLPNLNRDSSGCIRWTSSWQRPLRYQVVSSRSSMETPQPAQRNAVLDTENLLLPSTSLKRVSLLTRQIVGKHKAADAANTIQAYLRSHMRYSTNLGTQAATDPIDDFLFVRREGPCGHFASSMALMLRLAKIPSRVVAGYYKGEWNPIAGQVLIRERDAHAWVEAYIDGKGWVTYDPSPREAEAAGDHFHVALAVRQYWDYVGLRWDKLVIEYDLYAQVRAYENVRAASDKINGRLSQWWSRWFNPPVPDRASERAVDRHRMTRHPWTKVVDSSLILIVLAVAVRRMFRRDGDDDPAVRHYRRWLNRLARRGVPKNGYETGWEFAKRVIEKFPMESDTVRRVTQSYYTARFGTLTRKGKLL